MDTMIFVIKKPTTTRQRSKNPTILCIFYSIQAAASTKSSGEVR
jgi:hypothetical protein